MNSTPNRMKIEEAKKVFQDRPDFWGVGGGEFRPEIEFELDELAIGSIIVKYAMKGIAGIYQFFGPFVPTEGPLNAKFFQRADAELAMQAEAVNTRYFLEYTPEAESYFLAFDFANRTLISADEIQKIARECAHRLMARWQQIQRDGQRTRNEAASARMRAQGRKHGS